MRGATDSPAELPGQVPVVDLADGGSRSLLASSTEPRASAKSSIYGHFSLEDASPLVAARGQERTLQRLGVDRVVTRLLLLGCGVVGAVLFVVTFLIDGATRTGGSGLVACCRLPEFEPVAFRIDRPTKAAVLVLFDSFVDFSAGCAESIESRSSTR